jgi:hydrogenase expression/formation protein HypE
MSIPTTFREGLQTMILPPGKIPPEILEKTVFKFLGATRSDVILGPAKGEDASIVSDGCKLLALHGDPISGASEKIGWIAMNVATNDIATRGVRPRWTLACILLPEGSDEGLLERICRELSAAAKKLDVSIVGGHSEVTPGLSHPLVIVFAMGVIEEGGYVTCSGATPGSKIILSKSIGIEGTAILTSDRGTPLTARFGREFVRRAATYFDQLSVLKEAMIAFECGGVQAMHDPTEGGVSNGLHEVADSSGTGFRVYEDALAISQETIDVCRFFEINPLNLISSGSLLIIAEQDQAVKIISQLRENEVDASIIGEVLADAECRTIVRRDGSTEPLPRPRSDELWTALKKDVT